MKSAIIFRKIKVNKDFRSQDFITEVYFEKDTIKFISGFDYLNFETKIIAFEKDKYSYFYYFFAYPIPFEAIAEYNHFKDILTISLSDGRKLKLSDRVNIIFKF